MFMKKESRIPFRLPDPPRADMAGIERVFARLFSTDDGQKVLGYLNGQTFQRAAAMDAPDAMLRYMEGQRALMALIIRMIERGKSY